MTEWGGFKLIKDGDEMTAAALGIFMRQGASNPILPATRDRVLDIPGRNGTLYFGADLAERRITIPCAFAEAGTQQELEAAATELADVLIDANHKPARLELVFEADQERAWWVYYSGLLDLRRTIFDGEFDLPLMAPEPIPHAPQASS